MTETADVVVAGGGVMGASILFHLAQRDAGRLLLLERSTVGAGSTGRSSGVIRMHYSTEVNTRLSWESLPTWRNWRDAVGAGDAGWVRTGFMVFSDERYRPSLEAAVAMQQRCGVNTGVVGNDEAREIAPAFAIGDEDTVAYEPDSGYGDPSGAALGFLTRAREMGAEARLATPLTEIELAGDRVQAVRTPAGRIETQTLVVATGPWSKRVMARLGYDLPLRVTRHEVFMLRRPLDKVPFHPGGADMANLTYFRPEASDLTLVGNGNVEREADPDSYDSGISMEYLYDIWSRLAKRIPAMEMAEFTHGYAGLYTETPDSHPIIDRVEGVEGLFLCTGFSGHGFKLSPAVGKVVAELVLDGRARSIDIQALRLARFAENEFNVPQTTFRVLV